MNVQTTGIDNTRSSSSGQTSSVGLAPRDRRRDGQDGRRHQGEQLPARRAAPEVPFHLPTARSECTSKGPATRAARPAGGPADRPAVRPVCVAAGTYTDANENLALRAPASRAGGCRPGPTSRVLLPAEPLHRRPSPSRSCRTTPAAPCRTRSSRTASTMGAVLTSPLVIYATITGVPWQLIARQLSRCRPRRRRERARRDAGGQLERRGNRRRTGRATPYWDDIAGDPESYVRPSLPCGSRPPRAQHRPHHRHRRLAPRLAQRHQPDERARVDHPQPPGDIRYPSSARHSDRLQQAGYILRLQRRREVAPLRTRSTATTRTSRSRSRPRRTRGEEPGDREGDAGPGRRGLDLRPSRPPPRLGRLRLPPRDQDHPHRAPAPDRRAVPAGEIASDGSGEVGCHPLASRDEPCDFSNPGRSHSPIRPPVPRGRRPRLRRDAPVDLLRTRSRSSPAAAPDRLRERRLTAPATAAGATSTWGSRPSATPSSRAARPPSTSSSR